MAQVCYDLRFPVWSRNVGDYDVCVYVANWPAKRAYAWKQLLIARAIENQAFVLGVNRIGMDGEDNSGHAYHGGSLIIGPDGQIIVEADDTAQTLTASLDYAQLTHLRETFPVIDDGDDFDLLD
jgi:predicted amidohydrolase